MAKLPAQPSGAQADGENQQIQAGIETALLSGCETAIFRPGGWRGRVPRQPGQVRKEAALTSPTWVVAQPPTLPSFGRCFRLAAEAHATTLLKRLRASAGLPRVAAHEAGPSIRHGQNAFEKVQQEDVRLRRRCCTTAAVCRAGAQVPSGELRRSNRSGGDGYDAAQCIRSRPHCAGLHAHRRTWRR